MGPLASSRRGASFGCLVAEILLSCPVGGWQIDGSVLPNRRMPHADACLPRPDRPRSMPGRSARRIGGTGGRPRAHRTRLRRVARR
ncbi:hypothetical protein FRACA_160033 [Frankia canadensis]|uniref:Uncharacterized protein n=1 Tax=Frankia canadensis TaxID=1836972 RepID=A0A2I2KMI8_9ACTN|nr:hypothetical protein FRACA_160033 [Frankia canadensis]SOU54171.1 hypothetical protein FRACA_160033 [Frankia canadensis]